VVAHRQKYVPQFAPVGEQAKQTPYRDRPTGGSVQQGLSVAGDVRDSYQLGGAIDKRYSLGLTSASSRSIGETAMLRRQTSSISNPISWLLAAVLALSISSAVAQSPMTQWSTELHSFRSLTIADSDLLAGRLDGGREVSVNGMLSIPLESEGRIPVVILLHGAAGVLPYVTEWQQELASVGVAAFVIDSFTPRGISGTIADQDRLARLNVVVDAYGALALLAKHPSINPDRIVLMGFSRGADAALYSAMSRLHHALGNKGRHFAAHFAMYPNCTTRYLEDTQVDSVPIRIFHGSADDYAPIAPCRAYVERLRKAKADAQLTAFEGAQHVFMWSELTEPSVLKEAQTMRRCEVEEKRPGELYAKGANAPFSWKDACVQRGATVAYNAAAATEVRRQVKAFLAGLAK
jgi:dienelactone hydrolase